MNGGQQTQPAHRTGYLVRRPTAASRFGAAAAWGEARSRASSGSTPPDAASVKRCSAFVSPVVTGSAPRRNFKAGRVRHQTPGQIFIVDRPLAVFGVEVRAASPSNSWRSGRPAAAAGVTLYLRSFSLGNAADGTRCARRRRATTNGQWTAALVAQDNSRPAFLSAAGDAAFCGAVPPGSRGGPVHMTLVPRNLLRSSRTIEMQQQVSLSRPKTALDNARRKRSSPTQPTAAARR